MDRLVFTSSVAINEQGVSRQSYIHELANTSTVGFKGSYDVALRTVKVEGESFDTRYMPQKVSKNQIRMDPGTVMATGRALDVAMTQKTVLAVRADNGEMAFTRRGDLEVNLRGQLETGGGQLVLGENGPISVPPGLLVTIAADGTITARDPNETDVQQPVQIGRLLLRDASETPLSRRKDGLFQVYGKPPGADIPPGPNLPGLIPQALEGSNINPIEAMTRLLDNSRSFETQTRIIKETRDLDESGASMMKIA